MKTAIHKVATSYSSLDDITLPIPAACANLTFTDFLESAINEI